MNDTDQGEALDAAAVIAAFGGIRPMAHKLGVPVSTVQGWKQRGAIPENRRADVLAAAAANGVDLSAVPPPAAQDTQAEVPAEAAPPAPPPEPPAEPPAPGPSNGGPGGRNLPLAVAVVALVAALLAGGYAWWASRSAVPAAPGAGAPSGELAQRLDDLAAAVAERPATAALARQAEQIAELRARVERLAEATPAGAAAAADIDALAARVAALEATPPEAAVAELTARVADIVAALDELRSAATAETQAAATRREDIAAAIAELRRQLAEIAAARGAADRQLVDAVGLALAAGQLRRALDSGRPYADALAAARALAGDNTPVDAALDRLAERADQGIPTRDALGRTLPRLARRALADTAMESAEGWTDRVWQRVRNVVSVRRVGPDVPGESAEARLARAETRLLAGDLSGAVVELEAITDEAAAALSAWLADARARLAAEAAIDSVETAAVARLQAARGDT